MEVLMPGFRQRKMRVHCRNKLRAKRKKKHIVLGEK